VEIKRKKTRVTLSITFNLWLMIIINEKLDVKFAEMISLHHKYKYNYIYIYICYLELSTSQQIKKDKIPNFGFLCDTFKVDRFVSGNDVKK